jgi:hypothetical protein
MIDADIMRDDDAPEWTPEMFARAVARKGLKPVPKKGASVASNRLRRNRVV